MTTFVFANNIDTTLASSISSSATTITLSSGTNLPALAAGQTFVVTLNDAATQQVFEVMYATAISGTTLTVSRAQEGTTAQAWAAGDYVFSGPTAGQMRSFYQGQSVGQGSVTSVGMSMPSGFSVSGSPITVAGTLGVTFASQNAGLFLATPVTGGGAGAATWRSMAAADVNGALGYTAANDATVVHIAGAETITGEKTFSDGLQVSSYPASLTSQGAMIGWNYPATGATGRTEFINNQGLGSGGWNFWNVPLSGTMPAAAQAALSGSGSWTCTGLSSTGPLSATTGTFSGASSAASYQATGGSITIGGTAPGNDAIRISYTGTLTALVSGSSVGNIASFTTSAASFPGSVTCTTMNATGSDRRLKRDIKPFEPRPIHRTVPFVSYTLKENGWHGLGSVAQRMQKVAPEHVGEFDWHGKKRLSLDYGRAAYEEAMWAGLALDKALDRIKVLEKRLAALERRV